LGKVSIAGVRSLSGAVEPGDELSVVAVELERRRDLAEAARRRRLVGVAI